MFFNDLIFAQQYGRKDCEADTYQSRKSLFVASQWALGMGKQVADARQGQFDDDACEKRKYIGKGFKRYRRQRVVKPENATRKAALRALKTLQTDAYIGNAGQEISTHYMMNSNCAARTAMKLKGINRKGVLIDAYALTTHISVVISQ